MDLSIDQARRVALFAQGFGVPRPRGVGIDHVRAVLRRLGLVQLDFVNVVAPAHYQVLFSRLGPYDRALLDELVYRRREFTEQWAHEASIVPMDAWPLLRHRMESHRVRPWGFEAFLEKNQAYVERVMAEVRARGPLGAEVLAGPEGLSRRLPGTWVGTVPRAVLEAGFGRGLLAVTSRRPDYSRLYDLAERVVPNEHRARTLSSAEAQRELLRRAARAHGVATAADLADYHRMPVRPARDHLELMVEAGALRSVRVEGWREPAFADATALESVPRGPLTPAALLSPFDPLIWFRPRVARLFGFDYRVEIFVPPAQRRWGFYVFPFLHGERLAARVDLKALRSEGRLMVLGAWREGHADAESVVPALGDELHAIARWLGLKRVDVARRGNLARPLASALRAAARS